MEEEADFLGQQLCAAAGHDPMGMSTLLQSLLQVERIQFGFSRQPSFLATHPGQQNRATIHAARAGKISWRRDPRIGDPRAELRRATTPIRSFRPLSAENRSLIRARRLHVVTANSDESLTDLGARAGDSWATTRRAVMNGLFSDQIFRGGEIVKIARSEPYEPTEANSRERVTQFSWKGIRD